MERVKLITGLQIEEVVESYNHSFSPSDSTMLTTERKVHVVPIKHWVEKWVAPIDEFTTHTRTEEGYIAASPEIDEVLGKYLRCCHNEITYLKESETDLQGMYHSTMGTLIGKNAKLTKYETLTFWKRLKFLFKGSIYE